MITYELLFTKECMKMVVKEKLTGRLATVKIIYKQYRGTCQEIAECEFLGSNNDNTYYLLSADLYEYFDAI